MSMTEIYHIMSLTVLKQNTRKKSSQNNQDFVSLVEQELPTLPEHLSSPLVYSGVLLLNLQFYRYVLQIVVCPFVLFLLAIVLSVLLRYMDSDYPFGICKLFFHVIVVLTMKVSNKPDFYKFVLMYYRQHDSSRSFLCQITLMQGSSRPYNRNLDLRG